MVISIVGWKGEPVALVQGIIQIHNGGSDVCVNIGNQWQLFTRDAAMLFVICVCV